MTVWAEKADILLRILCLDVRHERVRARGWDIAQAQRIRNCSGKAFLWNESMNMCIMANETENIMNANAHIIALEQ